MSSVTNKGLSSWVAPTNCNKHGWRHLEAIFISRSNPSRCFWVRVEKWSFFIATTQPQYLPLKTCPNDPAPRLWSQLKWTSSRQRTQSGDPDWLSYLVNCFSAAESLFWTTAKSCSWSLKSFSSSSLILSCSSFTLSCSSVVLSCLSFTLSCSFVNLSCSSVLLCWPYVSITEEYKDHNDENNETKIINR